MFLLMNIATKKLPYPSSWDYSFADSAAGSLVVQVLLWARQAIYFSKVHLVHLVMFFEGCLLMCIFFEGLFPCGAISRELVVRAARLDLPLAVAGLPVGGN